LATLSDRQGAPDLIWPTPSPTTKSAIKVSSVSPLLCETITFHPADFASLALQKGYAKFALLIPVRSNALGNRPDLIDFKQQGIAGALINGHLNSLGIGYGQVITNNLDRSGGRKARPRVPVVLIKWILNRNDYKLS
jgi:hypothetical protein